MRRSTSFLLAMLINLGAAPGALAQWYGPDYRTCASRPTAEQVFCLSERRASWDKKLNKVYQQLMKSLDAPQRAQLRTAQRLWIQYRDANCAFYASGGGSIARTEAFECRRAMTQLRAKELEQAANP